MSKMRTIIAEGAVELDQVKINIRDAQSDPVRAPSAPPRPALRCAALPCLSSERVVLQF